MSYLARRHFLEETNWIRPFYEAAFPAPSEFGGPNLGLDSPAFGVGPAGDYRIAGNQTWGLAYAAVATPDRAAAVHALTHEHPMLTTPPPAYAWGPGDDRTGLIDRSDYVDGMARRLLPKRPADLYFDPCSANTYLGLGWKQMRGFQPARPDGRHLLYRDSP